MTEHGEVAALRARMMARSVTMNIINVCLLLALSDLGTHFLAGADS
jgi:hypothetical protein